MVEHAFWYHGSLEKHFPKAVIFFWEYFESQWRVLPTTDSVVTSCCKGGIDELS